MVKGLGATSAMAQEGQIGRLADFEEIWLNFKNAKMGYGRPFISHYQMFRLLISLDMFMLGSTSLGWLPPSLALPVDLSDCLKSGQHVWF
jgi:hypothetical protein